MCEYHLHCHQAFELKPSTILKLFNALDIWRKPEEFDDFLIACTADKKDRLGLENEPYPQAEYLTELAEKNTISDGERICRTRFTRKSDQRSYRTRATNNYQTS